MKYSAIIDGREREIEVTQLDSNRFRIMLDDETHEVDASSCGVDQVSLLIDNRSYDISYSFDNDRVHLNFWNQVFDIEVLDERKTRMRQVRSQLELTGPEAIKTSMPGKVVKVLVQPGQQVDAGAGIIIIEAMKMENEIQCRNAGVVKTVNVKAGSAVESDIILVEIDPLKS